MEALLRPTCIIFKGQEGYCSLGTSWIVPWLAVGDLLINHGVKKKKSTTREYYASTVSTL